MQEKAKKKQTKMSYDISALKDTEACSDNTKKIL